MPPILNSLPPSSELILVTPVTLAALLKTDPRYSSISSCSPAAQELAQSAGGPWAGPQPDARLTHGFFFSRGMARQLPETNGWG